MSAGIWIHKYSRFLRVSIYIYIRGARSAYVQDRRGMWCFNPSTDPGDYFFERRKGERGGWNRVRLCKTVTDIPRSYLSRIWRFDLIVHAIKPIYSDVSDVWREKYIRIPEWNRIFDSIKRRIRQGERGGREKLERIRESRRNSFQEISNRRSATPTWLFLAIPQDILPFPSHFVQFLSNFLPSIHFLAYSRVYERNFFVNCRDKQKKKKEKINQFSRNWLIKITREEKKSRYKAYTDERRKLETLSHSLSFRTKRGGKEGVEEK